MTVCSLSQDLVTALPPLTMTVEGLSAQYGAVLIALIIEGVTVSAAETLDWTLEFCNFDIDAYCKKNLTKHPSVKILQRVYISIGDNLF